MTRILVVGNGDQDCKQLLDLCHGAQFEVVAGHHTKCSLPWVQQQSPDLVLAQICNIGQHPFDFLTALRKEPSTVSMPYIFFGQGLTEEHRRQGMNRGADDYIVLPCGDRLILETIQARLDRWQTLKQQHEKSLEELRRNLTVALPHELRTPLQGIITSAELLREYWQTLDQEEITEITANIYLSSDRLNHLIQKFLLFFKLNVASHNPTERESLYRGSMGNSKFIMQLLAERAAQRFQRVKDLQFDLCEAAIAISEQWLGVIVDELVDNALKFSEPSLAKQRRGTTVEIRTEVVGEQWFLKIRDYGLGMSAENIARVGAYMQFDRMKYEQQGTGLGLAIVERIVKIYNGTMTIDSTVNEGTLITISLPLQSETEVEDPFIIG